jgi:phospholipase/carboxylesterase
VNIDPAATIFSAPERERAGRPLLVLLHGYASHEGDLFQLSPRLPLGPVIASLRAPISENGGWAWFSRAGSTPGDPAIEKADAAATAVLDWLDGVEFTSVALLGFSQGAAVALQALRLAPERFTSIVALSGFVASGAAGGDAALAERRIPVFWGRGTADAVIPSTAIDRTLAWLPEHSDLTERIYEGLGHSISSDELTDIATFFRGAGG